MLRPPWYEERACCFKLLCFLFVRIWFACFLPCVPLLAPDSTACLCQHSHGYTAQANKAGRAFYLVSVACLGFNINAH